jgi:ribosomal protein L34E
MWGACVHNNRCGACVRQRIIRAFLIEEQKIVKRLLGT